MKKIAIFLILVSFLQASLLFSAEIPREMAQYPNGKVFVRNNSGHAIIFKITDLQGNTLQPFRISNEATVNIAESAQNLYGEKITYGHTSDTYAGRIKLGYYYAEISPILQILDLIRDSYARTAKKMPDNRNIIIVIKPPINKTVYAKSYVPAGYQYDWTDTAQIEFREPKQISVYGAGETKFPISFLEDISIFKNLEKDAQEIAKTWIYMMQRTQATRGTSQWLKEVDPIRWAYLLLGLSRSSEQQNPIDKQVATIKKAYKVKVSTIDQEVRPHNPKLAQEAIKVLNEAADILLAPLGEVEAHLQPEPVAKEQATECSICLDSLASNPQIQLHCGHQFHEACISGWAKKLNLCPVCKKPIEK